MLSMSGYWDLGNPVGTACEDGIAMINKETDEIDQETLAKMVRSASIGTSSEASRPPTRSVIK